MPTHAEAPVVVEHLNHFYGKGSLRRQILHDISTVIPAGEIVIVTGPSGSGKTTLLTLVGALRAPQEGRLRVLGNELDSTKRASLEDVRRRIGFIFQQHNLLGALTASQNVQLGLRVSSRAGRIELKRKADAMLEAVGLGEHTHKRAEQMSGGQRQRVAIARALVGEPAMVLADEPTARRLAARWSTACRRSHESGARPSCWSRTTTASSTSPIESCTWRMGDCLRSRTRSSPTRNR
jgi:putative ABC transport system ATP-binding protein